MNPAGLRRLCYAWTAAGVLVLLGVTATFPVAPAIAFPMDLPGVDPRLAGVVFWTAIALLGSAIGFEDRSGAHFLMISGPLAAAAILGGPTAAVWVAAIGSIELREVRGSVPWYGVLASHAHLTMAWAAAGVLLWVLGGVDSIAAEPLASLAAILAAGMVANVIATMFAMWVVSAISGQPMRDAIPSPIRPLLLAVLADLSLGWLIAWSYIGLAWWSPAVLVLVDAVAIMSLSSGRAAWDLRHDRLTALPNSLSLDEHIARVERRRERSGIAVFYVDLDGFKAVNDDHGHAVGDEVLIVTARRLAEACRADDFLARLHGDEFVVVADNIDSDAAAAAFAQRLRDAVAQPIEREGDILQVGATVGYSLAGGAGDIGAGVRSADRAMNLAKAARSALTGTARSRR